jgi:hypothetical protein
MDYLPYNHYFVCKYYFTHMNISIWCIIIKGYYFIILAYFGYWKCIIHFMLNKEVSLGLYDQLKYRFN